MVSSPIWRYASLFLGLNLERDAKSVGFSNLVMGIFMTLRVVGELWRPAGGAYNVDTVLKTMVRGLEQELDARMAGKTIQAQRGNYPSPNVVAVSVTEEVDS